MGAYDPIPVSSPLVGIAKDLRLRQRREADTTAGQLHNTAARTKEQFDFLLRQTGSDVTDSSTGPEGIVGGDDAVHWLDFQAGVDPAVEVTTSSTGVVNVSWGTLLSVRGNGMNDSKVMVGGYVGLEVLDGFEVVVPIDQNWAAQSYTEQYRSALSRGRVTSGRRLALTPNRRYVFRCRRGYYALTTNDAAATIKFGPGTSIQVDKLGV